MVTDSSACCFSSSALLLTVLRRSPEAFLRWPVARSISACCSMAVSRSLARPLLLVSFRRPVDGRTAIAADVGRVERCRAAAGTHHGSPDSSGGPARERESIRRMRWKREGQRRRQQELPSDEEWYLRLQQYVHSECVLRAT